GESFFGRPVRSDLRRVGLAVSNGFEDDFQRQKVVGGDLLRRHGLFLAHISAVERAGGDVPARDEQLLVGRSWLAIQVFPCAGWSAHAAIVAVSLSALQWQA